MSNLSSAQTKYYPASTDGYISVLPTIIKKIVFTSTAAASVVVTLYDIAGTVKLKVRATNRRSVPIDMENFGGMYVNGPNLDMPANAVCTVWYETVSQTNSLSISDTSFDLDMDVNGYTITPVDTAAITMPKKARVATGWTITLAGLTGLTVTLNSDSGDGNSLYFSSAVSTYEITGAASATVTYNGTYFVVTKA